MSRYFIGRFIGVLLFLIVISAGLYFFVTGSTFLYSELLGLSPDEATAAGLGTVLLVAISAIVASKT